MSFLFPIFAVRGLTGRLTEQRGVGLTEQRGVGLTERGVDCVERGRRNCRGQRGLQRRQVAPCDRPRNPRMGTCSGLSFLTHSLSLLQHAPSPSLEAVARAVRSGFPPPTSPIGSILSHDFLPNFSFLLAAHGRDDPSP